jgi:hypothetical protein
MEPIYCCSEVAPFRPKRLDHEAKFTAFSDWAWSSKTETADTPSDAIKTAWDLSTSYVIQLVKQVNFGPLESKRYFLVIAFPTSPYSFVEVTEKDLIDANYQKLNS